MEANVHMSAGCVVFAKYLHALEYFDACSIRWHQNLRLLPTWGGIGAGLDHGDHDFAARITGAADVVLFTVNYPVITIEYRLGTDVLSIR